MEPALQINGLTKEYPGFKLDHVSFTLPCGTIMGLIGENGAGKSTTINAVLDLIRKDDGNILFWGKELSHNPRQLKEDIGVVFDGINFYETLTPVKVGKISAAAYRQWDPSAYKGFLEQFQLPADKEIKTFSKGMKMKLSIAAALSHHPKLLILDEATSGLDPVMVADYIAFIHQGKIVFSKPKDELIYNYGILRCGAEDFHRLDPADILAWRKNDYQWDVLVEDKKKAMSRYRSIVIDNPSIDDILLLYVKGEQVK